MTPLHVLDVAVIGAGGRMATRRGEHASFDHGAQYFTAHVPAFHAAVAQWQAAGVVTEWKGRIVVWDGANFADSDGKTRYVAEPCGDDFDEAESGEALPPPECELSSTTGFGSGGWAELTVCAWHG